MKIGVYCYLTADILTKNLQKYSLNSPLPNIWILSRLLNLIGCHGDQKYRFAKKYKKVISSDYSEVIRGMKLKQCINIHNISLYKSVFFIAVAHVLLLLWQLKVSIDL